MLHAVQGFDHPEQAGLIASMFADRKRVFVDLLGWDVPHDAVSERDQFDGADAEYLIFAQGDDHIASLRLLRTDGPHLLGSVFPDLVHGDVPGGPDIREISRFCISPRHRGPVRLQARRLLATALTEYALLFGLSAYTAVAHVSRMSNLFATGWRIRPLGLPDLEAQHPSAALIIEIDANTPHLLQRSGRYEHARLQFATRMAA
ncbi:acyl-homoserine-lactone synthase [Sphingomonas canadensis]|uniref:Acyl-homoserine-lactone synthase n=1 Tax=Sphingomonas canadensis TaxID=1219257 RepID=A0ABW3H510_9SPHN|nr:acyl-homoserine-lactone synthase [Sphingomonas canadensis]MCW3836648.1 autoinducer synthase [Sphingomonas canadensis]